jgi:hypothetical protein
MDNIRQRAHCIPCGVVIPSATFFDLTTANYQALHHAPNTATLLYPEKHKIYPIVNNACKSLSLSLSLSLSVCVCVCVCVAYINFSSNKYQPR